jgi:hypothetical protein
LFIQQLGRGLRRSEGKAVCTVLDFVGQHRKEFRYDRRFQALLGGSRAHVERQIKDGFPFLPSGCDMQLDGVAQERVLESIRNAIPNTWSAKVAELRALTRERGEISLRDYLRLSGLDLDDVYGTNRSWSDLCAAAGIAVQHAGTQEEILRRACGRLMHVDDAERLDVWRGWLAQDAPPLIAELPLVRQRLLHMLLAQLFDSMREKPDAVSGAADILWQHPQVRSELRQLFNVLRTRIQHLSAAVDADVPLCVHSQYTRLEILAATEAATHFKLPAWREGVRDAKSIGADVLAFTLDKTAGSFSPTTRYRDHAISRELMHWESQSRTTTNSPTGMRYQTHAHVGRRIFLFARLNTSERAFYFLGPATYVSHVGEMPMAITWRLQYPLPGDLFQAFAAAVA